MLAWSSNFLLKYDEEEGGEDLDSRLQKRRGEDVLVC